MTSPAGRLPSSRRRLRALPVATLLLTLLPYPGVGADAPPPVSCDRSRDRLSLHADQLPLRTLLGAIATQCGIAIRLDPAADGAISVNVDNLPVEVALERVTGRLNVVRQYRVDNGKRLLTALVILPAGVADAGRALPVAAPAPKEKRTRSGKEKRQGKDIEQEIARVTARAEKRIATLPEAEQATARARLERRIENLRKHEHKEKNEGERKR